MTDNVKRDLISIKELIETPELWCQDNMYRNENDTACVDESEACRRCLEGAIITVCPCGPAYTAATKAVQECTTKLFSEDLAAYKAKYASGSSDYVLINDGWVAARDRCDNDTEKERAKAFENVHRILDCAIECAG